MRPFKTIAGFLVLSAAISHAAETATKVFAEKMSPAAIKDLAIAAFQPPKVPFEARLMLTEWRQGKTNAEEVQLYFTPPEAYRIEFLSFNGQIQKTVLTNEKTAYIRSTGDAKTLPVDTPLQISSLLTDEQVEDLLTKNYIFEVKGTDMFIGRSVWLLQLSPRVSGKPIHELKVDRETQVVLEHRRYLTKEDAGSLTRFSTFRPNKKFAEDVFLPVEAITGFTTSAAHDLDSPTFKTMSPPPDSYLQLPAGFFLRGYRSFQVQGTTANYFSYTDGATPLSVFKTTLPVKFPQGTSVSDKLTVLPTEVGLSSADQIYYGRSGQDYYTLIGEISPDLLNNIANHFQ